MVDSSGIPRAFDVGSMRRELEGLKRQVALLESRRNYVALDRIVEGGTIAAGVGDKLTETVQEKIVVNGDNLAVDALYGKHIVGPLIETNTEPDVGAKLTDEGFVAHGRAKVTSSLDTKIQSTLGARPAPGDTSGYVQPGVWIDATPDDGGPYTPPQYSAGIFAVDAFAGALGLRSARDTLQSSYTQQSVGPGWSSLISYGAEQSPTSRARRETRVSLSSGGRFDLSAVGPGTPGYPGVVDAAVSHESDGILRLKGKNGVDIEGDLTINGEPYAPGGGGGGGGTPAPDPTPTPLVLAGLITSDQPAVAENDTAIRWNQVDVDIDMWGGSRDNYQPSRLYATRAGWYFLTGNVTFSNMGGGMRGVWFRVNGNRRVRGQSNPPPSAAQMAEIDAHNYVYLAQGDYVEVMATVAGALGAVSIKANQGTLGGLEWKRP